jgi:hypothetical protein
MARSYKIDRQDYSPPDFDPDMLFEAARAVLGTLADVQSQGASGRSFDTGFSVEVLTCLQAAMLEMLPALATARDQRLMAQSVGDRLADYIKQYRVVRETTGEPMLTALGATARPSGATVQ